MRMSVEGAGSEFPNERMITVTNGVETHTIIPADVIGPDGNTWKSATALYNVLRILHRNNPGEVLLMNFPAPVAPIHTRESSFDNNRITVEHVNEAVLINKREVRLSPNEYGFIACLAQAPGELFPYASIYQAVWGRAMGPGSAKTLRTCAYRVRQKLPAGAIKTHRNLGYSANQ